MQLKKFCLIKRMSHMMHIQTYERVDAQIGQRHTRNPFDFFR